jgi:hypothetical protein
MRFALVLIVLALPTTAMAATNNAFSGAQSDVITAIAGSSDGDTIFIPQGTNTWTTTLTVTKRLSFLGAGTNLTTLIMNVPDPGGEVDNGGLVLKASGGYAQVSNITFDGLNWASTKGAALASTISGVVRFHHNVFRKTPIGVYVNASWGVVDHNYFENVVNGVHITGIGVDGMNNWTLYYPIAYNSTNYLFVEDNLWFHDVSMNSAPNAPAFCSAGQGASYVARHNTFNWSAQMAQPCFDWHGDVMTDPSRGCTSVQIYLNQFNITYGDTLHTIGIDKFCAARGGQSLVYSNTINFGSGSFNFSRGVIYDEEGYPGAAPPWGPTQIPAGTGPLYTDSVTNSYQWANLQNGVDLAAGCDVGCSYVNYNPVNTVYPGSYIQPYPHPLIPATSIPNVKILQYAGRANIYSHRTTP